MRITGLIDSARGRRRRIKQTPWHQVPSARFLSQLPGILIMKTPIPAIFGRHKALPFFRNRRFLTRRFAAALMTLGAFLAVSTGAWADGRYYNSNATIYTSHPDWMGWLPESLKLSELSIPGTHDSGAYESYAGFTSSSVYTQGLTIASQLQAGIRFFDIRCRHIDNVFVLHHGDIVLDPGGVQLNYGAVLGTMNTFLDNHPSETIVMRIGGSGVPSASGTTRTYGETFNWYRDGTTGGRRIWQRHGNLSPRLRARGQMRSRPSLLARWNNSS